MKLDSSYRKNILCYLAAPFMLFCAFTQSYAAEFYILGEFNGDNPLQFNGVQPASERAVNILMIGEIVKGDVARFDRVLRIIEKNYKADYSDKFSTFDPKTILWLHSLGGSFTEGLRISKRIADAGIGTFLANNSRCYSACAIIFMHGSVRNLEVNPEIRREISPRAKLGFHAPYLNMPEGDKIDRAEVVHAYDYATLSIALLLETATNEMMPRRLVSEMLHARRDEFALIDTVDDIGRFWIDLTVTNSPTKITATMLTTACNSIFHHLKLNSALTEKTTLNEYSIGWKIGEKMKIDYGSTERYARKLRKLENLTDTTEIYRYTELADGPNDIACAIDVYLNGGKPKKAIIERVDYSRANNDDTPLDGRVVYWLNMLHPNTPLNELPKIFSTW